MSALAALLNDALARTPAVQGSDENLDAAAFDTIARTVAQTLCGHGITSNELVHLSIANRPSDLAGMLGIWRAGAVAVPVHASTPERVQAALQVRTGARFCVDCSVVSTIGSAVPASRSLLQDAALIVFTSGSTGEPKGVVIGHKRLAGKLDVLAHLLRLRADDIVLVPLQLTFIFGIWVSLLTMASGARLVLLSRFTPEAARAAFQEGATAAAVVPTMLRALIANGRLSAPWLRLLMTGGEPLGAALGRMVGDRFAPAEIYDLYGLTETGSCDFCLEVSRHADGLGTIGIPTGTVRFRITPTEAAPSADSGELQIHTPYGMLGYLDDPARTASAFADGYFRTGDLARLRPDGRVELIGRSKDVISRAGHKIAPLEIDNLFAGHPDVAAALGTGVPDEAVGERLHVVVVPRAGAALDEANLRAWAADRIERYKLPDAIHFRDALPVGRTGKADRAAVAKLVSEAESTRAAGE